MRLIDADALKQFEISFLMSDGYGYADVVYAGYIHQAPTIDAVPVKHGVWEKVKYEDDDGYFYLYVHKDCGCEQARERNYCPNCGAKMDGGKDDE